MVDVNTKPKSPARVLCVALARLIARLCQGNTTYVDVAKELDRLARIAAGLQPVKTEEHAKTTEAEDDVFAYWKRATGKERSAFTPDRRAKIRARLKHHSANELKQVIEWICNEPFYAGDNKEGRVYNDIELICRSDSKFETFLDRARESGVKEKTDVVTESKLEALEQAKFDAEQALSNGDNDAYSRAQTKIRNLSRG